MISPGDFRAIIPPQNQGSPWFGSLRSLRTDAGWPITAPLLALHAAPIFLADNEADDRFLIEHRLRKAGVKNPLMVFHDGAELVEILEQVAAHTTLEPCLILLDLNMPRVDGFEVIQWLQARPEFNSLPVAVITSSTRPSDRDRVEEAGVKEFLAKFPTESDLARLVAWASSHPFTLAA